jgi:N-acetylmuramoyl-L-alanine amidase
LFLLIIALVLSAAAGFAQQAMAPSLKLQRYEPESETTMTSASRQRFAVCTDPTAALTLNGKGIRVYPSGAAVGLVNLSIGENLFTFTATSGRKDTVRSSFLIVRSPPLATTSHDTLAIDSVMMEPSADLWLRAGDFLKVQLKGTPGSVVTFLDSIPMRELPLSEADSLGGVYQGVYSIPAGKVMKAERVCFRLMDVRGRSVEAMSRGSITVLDAVTPLVGRTRRDRPYLNFGLGEDRLGGAKMSFLVPGVKLTLTGKSGNQYRVGLAEGVEAWIPEDMVDLQPQGTYPPFSLTGSWTVSGDGKNDVVAIELGERLPYASFQETDPTRIVVDVYGAVSNSNWITQHATAREVKNVSYAQIAKDIFRVTIELRHRQIWGYDLSYRGTSLVITIRMQPERLKIGGLTFALDAGHGGTNEGAIGSTGAKEKDINLATVLHLKRMLEGKGATVFLTRSDDSFSPNSERLKRVIASGADILISIHSNSIGATSDPETVKGVSTYYKHICYRPLSVFILNEVLKTGMTPFGNVGSFNFMLNSPTELPNVLVELAFMSNPEDEMKLLDDEFRQELASRILQGIENFLENCEE